MKTLTKLFISVFIIAMSLSMPAQIVGAENTLNRRADELLNKGEYNPYKIAVKYKSDVGEDQKKHPQNLKSKPVSGKLNASVVTKKDKSKFSRDEMKDALKGYLSDPNVEYVEPAYIMKAAAWTTTSTTAKPGDFDGTKHNYLNTGKLPELWKTLGCDTTNNAPCGGSSSVTIAVLDSGLSYENWQWIGGANSYDTNFGMAPEVNQSAIFTNAGESYGDSNGDGFPGVENVDDDGDFWMDEDMEYDEPGDFYYDAATADYDDDENGYPDDVHGLDMMQYWWRCFLGDYYDTECYGTDQSKIGRAYDDDGHGTFVSNIINSAIDNAGDNVGIAYNSKVLPIKIAEWDGFSYSSDTIAMAWGVDYAIQMGADIINISFVTDADSSLLEDEMYYAESMGTVVVAAAGNGGDSLNQSERAVTYPAAYPTVISVGAATLDGNARATYSSYGSVADSNAILVDVVAATGEATSATDGVYAQALSCFFTFDCNYDYATTTDFNAFASGYAAGTSFSAPQVAAAIAYRKSLYPDETPSEIRHAVRASTVDIESVGVDAQSGFGLLQFDKILNPLNKSYFTWYDTSSSEKKSWILVGNPSTSTVNDVMVRVGDNTENSYRVLSQGRVTPSYPGLLDGPVTVSSTGAFYSTQRTLFEGSFNEYPAIREDQLTDKYYFTWNDTSSTTKKTWTLIGNPNDFEIDVRITIGNADDGIGTNEIQDVWTIPAKSRVTPRYDGILNGPVIVEALTPGQNFYTTQRVLFEGAFNEFAGIPANSLTDKYYFTWNDTSTETKKAWSLVGNPNAFPIDVRITIGNDSDGIGTNEIQQTLTVPAKGRVTPRYSGILNGPIKVEAVTPGQNFYTTQRVLFEGAFNEFAGIPANSLTDKYYFTWNDTSTSQRKAWTLVGNPNAFSINVRITIGNASDGIGSNEVQETFNIPAYGKITPRYEGILNGPVTVEAVTPGQNFYTTQRVLFEGSFNEFAGIPDNF